MDDMQFAADLSITVKSMVESHLKAKMDLPSITGLHKETWDVMVNGLVLDYKNRKDFRRRLMYLAVALVPHRGTVVPLVRLFARHGDGRNYVDRMLAKVSSAYGIVITVSSSYTMPDVYSCDPWSFDRLNRRYVDMQASLFTSIDDATKGVST